MAKRKPTTYTVLKGFNYGPDDVRVEPGPLTVELLPDVLADVLDAGAIVEGAAEPLPEPITEVEQWPSNAE